MPASLNEARRRAVRVDHPRVVWLDSPSFFRRCPVLPLCSLLLSTVVATVAMSTSPSSYAACRYFYDRDQMNCIKDSGQEHTWPARSKTTDPDRRA